MNDEHTILNHYNLTSPFPTSWPTEKDDSDASDDEKDRELTRNYIRRSRSRYSALERRGSDRRSLVPGSEKLPHGQENLVQKDEPDPLGGSDSVVKILRRKGLPVEEDSRLSKMVVPSRVQVKLKGFRKSILTLVHDLLAKPLPISGPFACFNARAFAWSRNSFTFHRFKIRLIESARRVEFRALRSGEDHYRQCVL